MENIPSVLERLKKAVQSKVRVLFGQQLRAYTAKQRNEQIRAARREALERELASLGFDTRGIYTNPLRGIGAALQIAAQYGITVHRGTCHGDCRASLPMMAWKNSLPTDVDESIINPWIHGRTKPEDVEEISTWGLNVEEAVARMLINGRLARII